MNSFFKKFSLLAVAGIFATSANAAERYKDRMFSVSKIKDVAFAKNVPHLNSYHAVTSALQAYNVKCLLTHDDPITVPYFYTNENDSEDRDLLLDLYVPKDDSVTKRAAVIVSHGGAMVAGSRDDYDQHTVNYCDSLAARGFVTASVEYRLGVTLTGSNYQLHIDSTDFARAVYRGLQDLRAAVRYMRGNAEELGIDPDRIYLVGNSAGAILSLENLYSDTEKDFPSYVFKSDAASLGSLDEYGVYGVNPRANGAAALWGAIHDPNMIGDNNLPVLLVHGTADETVLFKTGRPLGNVAAVLSNLIDSDVGSSLASYTLDLNAPTLYGSYVIDSVLTAREIDHESYFVEDVAHEFYDDDSYTEKVQQKVFDFLYKLTQSEPVVSIGESRIARAANSSNILMDAGHKSFTVAGGKDLQFDIYDLQGRKALTGKVSAGGSVDLSALNKGVFVLKIAGEMPRRFKMVK